MVTVLVFSIFRKVVIYNLLKIWLILLYYCGETEKLEKYYCLMEIYEKFCILKNCNVYIQFNFINYFYKKNVFIYYLL